MASRYDVERKCFEFLFKYPSFQEVELGIDPIPLIHTMYERVDLTDQEERCIMHMQSEGLWRPDQ